MTAADEWIYVVTDIEADGPHPGPNSMRSFASVAVSQEGTEHGRFEAVLEPLPGAAPNLLTFEWFQGFPDAWVAATTDPPPVAVVMADFVEWLKALPQPRAFVACPMGFDGPWIDYYLRRFTKYGLAQGPYENDRVFHRAEFCLASCAAAKLDIPLGSFRPRQVPDALLGDVSHTHRAIEDALGYANLLVSLMAGRIEA